MKNTQSTVLIADDAPGNIFLLKKILGDGYKVITAKNGLQAVDKITADLPDLVLLDVVMPEMDGYEVCRKIKMDSRSRDIPVIFITAKAEFKDERYGLDLGAVDYIIKPFSAEVVRARVETHLTIKRQRDILRNENSKRKLAEKELQKVNAQLDQKVKERTASLQRTVEKLELEVYEREITEAKRAKSEFQFKRLVEGIPGILYRISTKNGGMYFSPRLHSVLGFKGTDCGSLFKQLVDSIHPDDLERFNEAWLDAVNESELFDLEYRVQDTGGHWHWLHDRSIGIKQEENETTVEGLIFDITEKKQMYEDARKSQQQLIQADKMISLGILVSGVAHEINNPNHVIMSNLAFLANAWQEVLPILERYLKENGSFLIGGYEYSMVRDKIPESFAHLQNSSDRIKTIVRELRDYVRKQPCQINTKVSVDRVIKSAILLLSNMMNKDKATFKVRYGKDIPDIYGDYRRLEQVFINLIQNSHQAMNGKKGVISISSSYDEASDSVVVKVEDEGCGIGEDDLPRIMDPFFTTKRETGGTGLGLSVSAGIISDHRGWLEFSSKPGQGTSVRIILPCGRGGKQASDERRTGRPDRRAVKR